MVWVLWQLCPSVAAMLQTFLNALPISQNGKVAVGVAFVCGAAYLPIYFRGACANSRRRPLHCLRQTAADPPSRVPCVYERAGKKYIAYESMSEKREIMKEMELADREAARVARKAAAPAR